MLTIDCYRTGNAHVAIDHTIYHSYLEVLRVHYYICHSLLHDDVLYTTLRCYIYLFEFRIWSISCIHVLNLLAEVWIASEINGHRNYAKEFPKPL